MKAVEDYSDYLVELEDNLNRSIERMANDPFKMFYDPQNNFRQELICRYKNMKAQIKDQKDEKANLREQIYLLNQEIKLIFQNIIKLGTTLSALEKSFGFNKNLDNERKNDG